MRAKLYEKYYKLGFSQDMCKSLHLKKPKKNVKRFYYLLMALVFTIGMLTEL
jgi:hypothetical protein